ncbi:MFS transporter [Saccharophagus degradans]|uniref:MFS transporter n=1 Tax=Saccharophagus degradans TaxID=86304 RepID=UPI0024782CD7|nr:MFS transporter [Saccharophagus degradans]WGO96789.1 MFS transporter [Saccharophagus degradans]
MNHPEVNVKQGHLRRFLIAHGLAAITVGIHLVLLSWLSVGVLHLSSAYVGWVQAAALIPSLFSIVLAGVLADRHNPAVLMVAVQLTLAITFTVFALLLHADKLTFAFLLVYGALVGSCNGLVQPVREKLLMQLDTVVLQRKISSASAVQFSCQGAGVLLVTLSVYFDMALLLGLQALLSVVAAIFYSSLARAKAKPRPPENSVWREPLILLRQNVGLRQLLCLAAFNGYMHLGVFVVVLPILARDVYALNSQAYAFLQFTFVVGMILANIRLLYTEKIRFPGQGALFSLLYTGVVGVALSRQPTLVGLYLLVGVWGWVAGNSAGLSRIVLQSLVAFSMKGRVMALYQFILFGMAPLGALAAGYALHWFSLPTVFIVMSVSSALLFVLFLFSKTLWAVEQAE